MNTPVCCKCGNPASMTANAKPYCPRCMPREATPIILPQPAALTWLLALPGLAVVSTPDFAAGAIKRRREMARRDAERALWWRR